MVGPQCRQRCSCHACDHPIDDFLVKAKIIAWLMV